MTPSGAEFIKQVKAQIDEVDPSEVSEHVGNGDLVLVDVRETEEWDRGHLPGAKHVARGHLESRIEGATPRPQRARRPVLRVGQPQRAGGQDAARRPRLRRTSPR